MKQRLVLCLMLACVPVCHAAPVPSAVAGAEITKLLDKTVWVDIGTGRSLASVGAKEITALKVCKMATMAIRRAGNGWEQIFYPGLEMRINYASAVVENAAGGGMTVRFFAAGRRKAAATLRLSPTHDVVIQETQGFRPHTYLKCDFTKPATRTGQ